MRQPRWRTVLGSFLAAAFVCGCGALQGDSRPVLRIANWGGAGDDSAFMKTIRLIYEEFGKKENCHVRVEGVPGSQDYVSKMLLNHVAGVTPDIVTLDASSAAVFIESGALMDLRPYFEKDPEADLDAFFPNVANIARRGEAVYAIPGDFTPMVLYYNKRMFDEAGVPYPDGSWTFDKFREVAVKLTKPPKRQGDQPQQYGFSFSNWMPGWIVFLWNNGADVLSPDGSKAEGYLDSDKSVEAVTFLKDLVNAGIAPSLSASSAAGVDFFANGQAAMEISGHWRIIGFKEAKNLKMSEVGVAPVPTNLPKGVTVMYEAGLAISKQARNPDLAWKYLKYFTSHRIQKRYNATGIAVDARRDVAQEVAADPLEAEFLKIVPSARGPWGARVIGYDYVESAGQKAMDAILLGGDPKAELQKAARRIDAYFAIR